jgi:hypothetical protein
MSPVQLSCAKLLVGYRRLKPVPVATRSEAKALIARTLRPWIRIPLKFVIVFVCCVVLCR